MSDAISRLLDLVAREVPGTSKEALHRLACALRVEFGGDALYVPKSEPRTARDAAVVQAFDGRNRNSVCRRFGISRSTFYEIMKRTREDRLGRTGLRRQVLNRPSATHASDA